MGSPLPYQDKDMRRSRQDLYYRNRRFEDNYQHEERYGTGNFEGYRGDRDETGFRTNFSERSERGDYHKTRHARFRWKSPVYIREPRKKVSELNTRNVKRNINDDLKTPVKKKATSLKM